MSRRLQWLCAVIADGRISATVARVAAIATHADEGGRLVGRAIDLSAASFTASRHLKEHLETLSRMQYIKVEAAPRHGRLIVAIASPQDDLPLGGKNLVEIVGAVVGIASPKTPRGQSKTINIYIDGAEQMAKIAISREDAEAIVAALVPAGARDAPVAVS